jgi:hypothetical protein
MKSVGVLLTLLWVTQGCTNDSSPGESGNDVVGEGLSCAECTIQADTLMTIDSLAVQGPSGIITHDRDGRVVLHDGYQVLVVDAEGRRERAFGRKGGGPGEFETVRNVLTDSSGAIHILDSQLARWSVFSSEGEFMESVTAPALVGGVGYSAALLPDNRLVVNWRPTAAATAHGSVVVLDGAEVAESLAEVDVDNPHETKAYQRLLLVRRSGEIVVGEPHTFSLQVYGAELSNVRTVRRTAAWTPTGSIPAQVSDGVFDIPATPSLRGLWEDASGRIWLYMTIPAATWKPEPPPDPGVELSEEEYLRLADRSRLESIVEVIDLDDRKVIARQRFDGPLGLPFGEGYFAWTKFDGANEPRVVVTRLNLHGE